MQGSVEAMFRSLVAARDILNTVLSTELGDLLTFCLSHGDDRSAKDLWLVVRDALSARKVSAERHVCVELPSASSKEGDSSRSVVLH